jgi:hypothetical protein
VTLHDEMLDAEVREKQRQRQPDEAAANDQNGNLVVGLDQTPTLAFAAPWMGGAGLEPATSSV